VTPLLGNDTASTFLGHNNRNVNTNHYSHAENGFVSVAIRTGLGNDALLEVFDIILIRE